MKVSYTAFLLKIRIDRLRRKANIKVNHSFNMFREHYAQKVKHAKVNSFAFFSQVNYSSFYRKSFCRMSLKEISLFPRRVRCSVTFRWHKKDLLSGCWLWTSLTLNKVCIPHSVELQTSRELIFTGWYLLDPWQIALSMLLCYCWGSGEDFISGLGCCQTLLRVRQTLIKLSGCFVGTSSALAVLRLTAQHLSHCA